ncbi:MAG: biotin--[acetyl-CoA-carboxylase] ligase, partial [Thiomonas sp.]
MNADPLGPLRAQLAHTHPACAVRWVERTGSTNADLLAAARFGQLDSPTLLATRQQTAGRGRQGRVWLDDAQTSVLCSVAWPFAPQHDIRALSLAVGVWLTQALHALGASSVRLKWPNDLLLPVQGNWRKLGGVLVEMADTATTRWVVIGFGLNLRSPPGQTQATGLDAAGLTLDRGAALAALAPALLDGLQGGLRQRDAALADRDEAVADRDQAEARA